MGLIREVAIVFFTIDQFIFFSFKFLIVAI